MNSSKHISSQGARLGWRQVLCKSLLPLAMACTVPTVWATHVGLYIDATRAEPSVFENGIVGLYNPVVVTAAGRATVTAGLRQNYSVATGKRAVTLVGFMDEIILLDALAPVQVQISPNVDPEWIQMFTLDFYSNLPLLGVDPVALLAGYSNQYLVKSLENSCPAAPGCLSGVLGDFDITQVMGNPPDTLRLVVHSDILPVPEPSGGALAVVALFALGLARRRIRSAG